MVGKDSVADGLLCLQSCRQGRRVISSIIIITGVQRLSLLAFGSFLRELLHVSMMMQIQKTRHRMKGSASHFQSQNVIKFMRFKTQNV